MITIKNTARFLLFTLISFFSCQKEETLNKIFDGNVVIWPFSDMKSIRKALEGKEIISGRLTISDYFGDLSFLNNIQVIKGDFNLTNCPRISDLTFISRLEVVEGIVRLEFNHDLVSLKGLENLDSAGSFSVYDNHRDLDVSAIADIRVTGGFRLASLARNVQTPFLNIRILSGDFTIQENPGLTDLICLPNLEKVGGGIYILSNDTLSSLQGLNSLTRVDSFFRIVYNDDLKDVDGLSALKTVGGELTISGNPQLESLGGLNQLERVSRISIHNTNCTDLQGLNHLLYAKGIVITKNFELADFCAIKPVLLTNDSISIYFNKNLLNPSRDEIILGCQ